MKLYNTRTRKEEVFSPIADNTAKIYSCGPTVYHYAHIGNLRSFVFADLLKRALLYNNYQVEHVMNITDVGHLTSDADEGEDKMLKGAKREKKTVWQIAEYYTNAFKKDIQNLNLLPFTQMPKATDHIQEMIDLNKKLEANGYTYTANGNLYFNTEKFKDYTKLAKLPSADTAQSRVEEDQGKKNPRDFVLWFTKSKFDDQEMKWDSPWGVGYPGWHIECSAMSIKYLGEHFDIHTGGIDHIPVHHTNELAQSECACQSSPWVNFWMHSNFLKTSNEKMSKSSGDFLTLQSLINKGYNPLHYRYFLLTAHYRQELTFTFEALDAAKNTYERLKNKIIQFKESDSESGSPTPYHEEFKEAINNDLNMPKAIASLWKVLDSDLSAQLKYQTALDFDKILGLDIENMKEEQITIPSEVQTLLDQRQTARVGKDYAQSDKLRDQIKELGFIVKDTKDGQKLSKE